MVAKANSSSTPTQSTLLPQAARPQETSDTLDTMDINLPVTNHFVIRFKKGSPFQACFPLSQLSIAAKPAINSIVLCLVPLDLSVSRSSSSGGIVNANINQPLRVSTNEEHNFKHYLELSLTARFPTQHNYYLGHYFGTGSDVRNTGASLVPHIHKCRK